MPSPSRRRLLQVGFTSTASLVGLAGCLDESSSGEDTTTSPSETTDETGTATATTTQSGAGDSSAVDALLSWVPAPEAFPPAGGEFELLTADAATIYERREAFAEDGYERFRKTALGAASLLELEQGTVEAVVQAQSSALVLASTGTADADLATAFTDAGLTEDGTVAGRTQYTGSVDGANLTCVAVDGTVVVVQDAEAPTETIAAVLGAKNGEEPRYVGSSEDLATVREALPGGHFAVMVPRDIEGSGVVASGTGFGYAWTFGPAETTVTVGIAYPEGEVPAGSDLTAYLADRRGFRDYGEFTVESRGRVLLATGTIPTENFDLLTDGDPGERTTRGTRAPQVQFDFEYDPDAGEVVITHYGGDELQAANLTVRLEGEATAAQWAQTHESVQAGDALTVDVSGAESGAAIQIVWAEDGVSSVLARFTLP
ncbi:hypothetical protein [Haloarchaeobius amylolyticus]|uniref:hypothetical protein n=1 Tax=Haloarchaeobius amylolyticus TaxID=1198296 RepID=UPI002270A7E5|nr:hypothetical protein [Haloarchaeobius amylolyticus]